MWDDINVLVFLNKFHLITPYLIEFKIIKSFAPFSWNNLCVKYILATINWF